MGAEPEEEELLAEEQREIDEFASLLPRGEWERLQRLNWIAHRLLYGLIFWVVITVFVHPGAIGRDLLKAYRNSSGAWATVAPWVITVWFALFGLLVAGRLLAWRLREGAYRGLARRGYDTEEIRAAITSHAVLNWMRQREQEERVVQAEDERWRAERAAAAPWWRTEVKGGHLLLNLYMIGGAIVVVHALAAPTDKCLDPFVGLIGLGWFAILAKFVFPAVFAFCVLHTNQMRHDLRRYYRWLAHSKVAVALLLLLGLLFAMGMEPFEAWRIAFYGFIAVMTGRGILRFLSARRTSRPR